VGLRERNRRKRRAQLSSLAKIQNGSENGSFTGVVDFVAAKTELQQDLAEFNRRTANGSTGIT
jgi:hypothetical protein